MKELMDLHYHLHWPERPRFNLSPQTPDGRNRGRQAKQTSVNNPTIAKPPTTARERLRNIFTHLRSFRRVSPKVKTDEQGRRENDPFCGADLPCTPKAGGSMHCSQNQQATYSTDPPAKPKTGKQNRLPPGVGPVILSPYAALESVGDSAAQGQSHRTKTATITPKTGKRTSLISPLLTTIFSSRLDEVQVIPTTLFSVDPSPYTHRGIQHPFDTIHEVKQIVHDNGAEGSKPPLFSPDDDYDSLCDEHGCFANVDILPSGALDVYCPKCREASS